MLFLHALLFSILATSTLAIPAGLSGLREKATHIGHKIKQVVTGSRVKPDPYRIDGTWHSNTLDQTIAIYGCSIKLPDGIPQDEKQYEKLFSKSRLWKRVGPGPALTWPRVGTEGDGDEEHGSPNDVLLIKGSKEGGLDIRLKPAIGGEEIKYRGSYALTRKWVEPINKPSPEVPSKESIT